MIRNIASTLVTLFCLSTACTAAHAADTGAVFVMTNAADHNQVIAYQRQASGRLQQRAIYDTEGRGSITLPQGSTNLDTAVTGDGKYLYTLNVGTGTVGILRVDGDGTLTQVGDETGLTPSVGYQGLAAL